MIKKHRANLNLDKVVFDKLKSDKVNISATVNKYLTQLTRINDKGFQSFFRDMVPLCSTCKNEEWHYAITWESNPLHLDKQPYPFDNDCMFFGFCKTCWDLPMSENNFWVATGVVKEDFDPSWNEVWLENGAKDIFTVPSDKNGRTLYWKTYTYRTLRDILWRVYLLHLEIRTEEYTRRDGITNRGGKLPEVEGEANTRENQGEGQTSPSHP